MTDADDEAEFERFLGGLEPKLRRAVVGHVPPEDAADAVAEAFAYAWQHWNRVRLLDNPGGYLFRVAQSKSRQRKQGREAAAAPAEMPGVEPGLVRGMRSLPPQQRSAVWLVHGCGWTYAETAVALGISASAVGTHVSRGLASLRLSMGAVVDD